MSKTVHELTRKEMKGPDKFQRAAAGAARWVADHQKHITAAVVAALGALAVGTLAWAWLGHREEEAGADLSRAIEYLRADISGAPPSAGQPTFKSDADRQRAIIAAAAEVRSSHPSSRAALTAALASGEAHLRLGQWDAALADYQTFLDRAGKDDSLRFAALEGVARAQEGKGALAEAGLAWERVGAEAPEFKDRAAIERARVLARAGQVAEAKKILEGFGEAFQDSQLRPEAQELLARLGAAGGQ